MGIANRLRTTWRQDGPSRWFIIDHFYRHIPHDIMREMFEMLPSPQVAPGGRRATLEEMLTFELPTLPPKTEEALRLLLAFFEDDAPEGFDPPIDRLGIAPTYQEWGREAGRTASWAADKARTLRLKGLVNIDENATLRRLRLTRHTLVWLVQRKERGR